MHVHVHLAAKKSKVLKKVNEEGLTDDSVEDVSLEQEVLLREDDKTSYTLYG